VGTGTDGARSGAGGARGAAAGRACDATIGARDVVAGGAHGAATGRLGM